MSHAAIDSIDALEGVVGKTPGAMHLKVIDHLDKGALRWIASAPVMFSGFAGSSGIGVTIGGGKPGFAYADTHELRLSADILEIGRASCRERVCQYVSISVVAGSFKKKKHDNK